MRNASGFTLIELMVAVAVVAILTAIALPAYQDYVLRGKFAEAYSTLGSQRVKMEQYYQDIRDYTNACQANTVAPQPTGTYFTYVCSNLGPNTYTITATGIPGQGVPSSFVFSIDQNNNKQTVSVGPGWTMPTQTATSGCWVRTKGGSC
ncbi:MAG TPA: type IV pilin protein [Burkholderiales bacterium]|nr:type IV pilin protein [Burkholderiales bacterium]